ncbi:MAG: NAD(+) synthase [Crocinitomicaceae bacterium]
MRSKEISEFITTWLRDYCDHANQDGFIIGISGGIDSAVTSMLCALTEKKVILLSMPIRQTNAEYSRAMNHISDLKSRFSNVSSFDIDLTDTFSSFEKCMPFSLEENHLSMANSRARLRMTALYALGQANRCLVAGTGNKIEDFGIGFYTKYGDGGVDLSPIADLTKTQVWAIAKEIGVIQEIIDAKPTDGLWEDSRSDEDQIGASYPELEWAMGFQGDETQLNERENAVLAIYNRLNKINKHKMEPIPVCKIPTDYFN